MVSLPFFPPFSSTPRVVNMLEDRFIGAGALLLGAGACMTEDGGSGAACGTGEGGTTDEDGRGAVC